MFHRFRDLQFVYRSANITTAIETFAVRAQVTHGDLRGGNERLHVGLSGFLRLEDLSAGKGGSDALAAADVGVHLHTRLLLRSWLVMMTRERRPTMRSH